MGVPNDLKAVAGGIKPQHQQGRRFRCNRYVAFSDGAVGSPPSNPRCASDSIGAEVFYLWAANLHDAVLQLSGNCQGVRVPSDLTKQMINWREMFSMLTGVVGRHRLHSFWNYRSCRSDATQSAAGPFGSHRDEHLKFGTTAIIRSRWSRSVDQS